MRIELVDALRLMFINERAYRRLNQGAIDKIPTVDTEFETKPLELDWWVASPRLPISLFERVIALYVLVEVPRIYGMVELWLRNEPYVRLEYLNLAGDFLIPFILLILDMLYLGFYNLRQWFDFHVENVHFKALPEILMNGNFDEVEEKYQARYFRPILLRAVYDGFDLAFKRSYQLASGIIAILLAAIVGFSIGPLPPPLAPTWFQNAATGLFYFVFSVIMFMMGMFAWTFFLILMTSAAIAAVAVLDFRPEAGLRRLFSPLTDMILRNTTAYAMIIALIVPVLFLWAVVGPASASDFNRSFARVVLLASSAIILLSFLIPTWFLHVSMRKSKERKLMLLEAAISKSEQSSDYLLSPLHRYLERSIRLTGRLQAWPVHLGTLVNVIGVLILPFLTFILSGGTFKA